MAILYFYSTIFGIEIYQEPWQFIVNFSRSSYEDIEPHKIVQTPWQGVSTGVHVSHPH